MLRDFRLTVRGIYLPHEPLVDFTPKSERPEKQRAEMMTLVKDVLRWAKAQDIHVAVSSSGVVTVEDGREAAKDAAA